MSNFIFNKKINFLNPLRINTILNIVKLIAYLGDNYNIFQIAKWADYLISEVSYDSNHLILKIKQHTDNGKTISQGDIVDRDTLANNLGHGAKYRTLYNSLEKVRIGKNVRYFRAYEHHYIRTVSYTHLTLPTILLV